MGLHVLKCNFKYVLQIEISVIDLKTPRFKPLEAQKALYIVITNRFYIIENH